MTSIYIYDIQQKQYPTLAPVDGKTPSHIVEMSDKVHTLGQALKQLHNEGKELMFLNLTKPKDDIYADLDWMDIKELFRNTEDRMINLSGSHISDCYITGGFIRNVNFNSCSLTDMSIKNVKITNTGFNNTHTVNLDLKGSVFYNCSYKNAAWKNSVFEDNKFDNFKKDEIMDQITGPQANISRNPTDGFTSDFGEWRKKNTIAPELTRLRKEKRVNSSSGLAVKKLTPGRVVDAVCVLGGVDFSLENSMTDIKKQFDGALHNYVDKESNLKQFNAVFIKEVEKETKSKWEQVGKFFSKKALNMASTATSSEKMNILWEKPNPLQIFLFPQLTMI